MNRNSVIENIRMACHCGERRAGEYLDAELRNLRELQLRNELRYDDLETVCSSLGLDYDCVEYFLAALAV